MAEYYVTKREKCPDNCDYGIFYERISMTEIGGAAQISRTTADDPTGHIVGCKRCCNGDIETQVPLLDVLVRLRFAIDGVSSDKFENLRLEDE